MTERILADVPAASSRAVHERMSRQPKRDTSCELRLRSALFARGQRYRVHYRVPEVARRTIDIAFVGSRVAVFLDGCFWHGCPVHGAKMTTNGAWWARKIARNRERDAETDDILRASGWCVTRIWEHVECEDAVRTVEALLARTVDA
jgi:DNA mismatch endonuclease (patch repair protein)